MSDTAGGSPPRRPATARRRSDAGHDAAAPTRDELEAMELQLASLPLHSGATLEEVPELGVVLLRQPGYGPGLNFAARVRWPAADVSERLHGLHEHMQAHGEWPALVVAEGLSEPGDLPLWLGSNGWIELERERVMWTRHPPTVPHLDPALRVEAVTPRSAAEFETVEREVFGVDAARAAERAERVIAGVEQGQFRAYLVRLRGAPVATARLASGKGVAGIYGVGVAAAHRRQGYGSLVTAIATRAGLAGGGKLVWLSVDETNSPAINLYRRLGYQPIFSWTRWIGSTRHG
ncbi:MAG TPA: N-acetyltransferase [Candidatus Limnocylindria bacterium]|nr:N-acetyltransferase [Candidatus Limnocylindria bacterium]